MRQLLYRAAQIFGAACAAVLILFLVSAQTPAPTPTAGSVVFLGDARGHGSGVHIGDGYILTAAHVVRSEKTMPVVMDDGVTVEGAILWASPEYDVALIRAPVNAKAAPLACREAKVGEEIRASGNPYDQKFVTARGHVSGAAREYEPWKRVLVLDTTMVHGMSGGPTFDMQGNVIGINVGVMVVSQGVASYVASFGYIVPGSTVCMLMGREG
ncbi:MULTISPECIES: serine protease [unclassified Chelatococcus]|uniref:S1C family serine protease n=1 Tax=unclassified Chelatococcus TaxID=2638111 RepID=UPI001BD0847E|nr:MULTISPECIES: serine protease [unclassified Chelatococcus]MBS7737956.1 trypsin-like peptidase domain-containing protein [Chelatococcus sp. HY11]MCO5077699.1 serine protease [Chelatococcus sp.]